MNDRYDPRAERDRERGEQGPRDYRDDPRRDYPSQSRGSAEYGDATFRSNRGWSDSRSAASNRAADAARGGGDDRGSRSLEEEDYRNAARRSGGPSDLDYSHDRYGSDFGRRDFMPEESPSFFGTGNYSSGGSGLGGGFRGMQGMGAFSPSGGQYNAEYGNPSEGSYLWSGREARDARGEPNRGGERGRHRHWFGRFFGRGPKGYTRSDERVREDISERLMHSGSIDASEVTVTVNDAIVTLEGTVPDRNMKHDIENIADACIGVKDVDNRIRVQRRTPDWEDQPTTAAQTATSGTTSVATGTMGSPKPKSN